MKKVKLTLDQYLKLGGKIENVNWSNTFCTYYDDNKGLSITSYEDKNDTHANGNKLIYFTFSNGKTHRYALLWIETEVEMILDSKYTK